MFGYYRIYICATGWTDRLKKGLNENKRRGGGGAKKDLYKHVDPDQTAPIGAV